MFNIGKVYHGFKMIEEKFIEEIQSLGRLFIHEKSGARLLHLANEDNNKVFSIGFKTPPKNSTGVAHILEHSVLAGSRKYTTKEPFMDMLKSSLRTFINAMTFPDKTIYPVGSRNDKDFKNLMDVYLDAVFYPRIYEVPEIFMQEGWHYEIFKKEDDIIYRGVVYNEMKGAYSSPETILHQAISQSLLPDTCYGFSSGGDPDVIPELTKEEFLDFHKNLYHPVNSYIFLYGDGEINEQLSYINENYLSHFDKIEIDSNIKNQLPKNARVELVDYYNIASDENEENKDFLSLNFFHGELKDLEAKIMNDVMARVLIRSDAAPLKIALLKEGIGQDIMFMTEGGKEIVTGFAAKNTSEDKKEEFINIIYTELEKLVNEGIDKELLKASINVVEYSLREPSFPTKGIIYKIMAMEGWLYDRSPITQLEYNSVITKLKDMIDTDYFERYIKENYLDNKNTSIVVVKPKKGLSIEKEEKVKQKLAEYKKSLSEEELNKLIEENHKLKAYQEAENSEEAKATIPKLAITDVDKKAEETTQVVSKKDNYTLIHNNIFTSKIAYLDLIFDTSMVEVDDLPYLGLLTLILGKVDTKTKSYMALSNEIFSKTGGISFETDLYSKDGKTALSPKLIVSGKAIGEDIKSMLTLYEEIIFDTLINNPLRIKELVFQTKSRLEMMMSFRGNSVVSSRVSSYYSVMWNLLEKLKGLDFYWFLSDLVLNFDSVQAELLDKLNGLYNKVFNLNNLIVSFTGDDEDLKTVEDNLQSLVNKLKNEPFKKVDYNLEPNKLNEGIQANYNVQYVAKGYNYKDLGHEYSGSLQVVSTILNGDYLHNRVRAQGGAYGVGVSIDRLGNLVISSYRDPNLKETINVYDEIANFLNNLELNEVELTQYIIGTIARLEPALTPSQKGRLQTRRYLNGITQTEIQKVKDEVLGVTLEQVKAASKLFQDTMEKGYVCVLGNEQKIFANKDVFKNLIKLSK